jgi:hypothetical protein
VWIKAFTGSRTLTGLITAAEAALAPPMAGANANAAHARVIRPLCR